MSSPTELLTIAGKAAPPAQAKQVVEAEKNQKTLDFSDTYQEEAAKPKEAVGPKAEAEATEDLQIVIDESVTVETEPEVAADVELDKPKEPDLLLATAPKDQVEVLSEPSQQQAEDTNGVPKFSDDAGETVTATPAKSPEQAETTDVSKSLVEQPLEQEADLVLTKPDVVEKVTEVAKLVSNSEVAARQKQPLAAAPTDVPKLDTVSPDEERPERLEAQRVVLSEPSTNKTNTAQQPSNISVPVLRELSGKQDTKEIELTKATEIETEVANVKTADTPVKPVVQPTAMTQAQPAVPAWMTLIQTDQSKDIATTALPNALEELSGYQQQARFEPISAFQRYDVPTQSARQVVQQVAYAISQNAPGTTEIKLSPEELGRVRMTVQAVEGMINVAVVVERQETGDLMRRNSEMLTEELRDLGFDTINLTFGNEQSGPQSESESDQAEFTVAEHMPSSENGKTLIVSRTLSEGLDLRM